jgi:hypothetical protein
MDGKLAVILRESNLQNSEAQSFIDVIDEVILYARFNGRKSKTINSVYRIEEYPDWCRKKISILIPTDLQTDATATALVDDFLTLYPTATIYVDSSNENVTNEFVSKLVSLRPEIGIGLINTLFQWSNGEAKDGTLYDTLRISKQVFACPILSEEVTALDERLLQLSQQMPEAVPVLLALTDDDKARFSMIQAKLSSSFAKFIFWTPFAMKGIHFSEVQMQIEETDEHIIVPNPPADSIVMVAKLPGHFKMAPNIDSKTLGNIEEGQRLNIKRRELGLLGINYGQTDDGSWVILSRGQTIYFVEETI